MLTVSSNHIVLGGGSGGGGGGSGDVVGAASSTDNAIARFDGVTGKLLQNSKATLLDDGTLKLSSSVMAGYDGWDAQGGAVISSGANPSSVMFMERTGGGFALGMLKAFGRNTTTNTTGKLAEIGIYGSTPTTPDYLYFALGNSDWSSASMEITSTEIVVASALRLKGALKDSTGSSGTNGQVLKNVDGLVVWSNP